MRHALSHPCGWMAVVAASLICPPGLIAQDGDPAAHGPTRIEGGQVERDGEVWPYAVQIPRGVSPGFPVILALHGAGSRGTDGLRMRSQSIAEMARRFPERYPAIVVMPQTPGRWTAPARAAALEALEATVQRYEADRGRVYVVGQSMGADGALELASEHPERFAGVVLAAPGCCDARYDPERLRSTPVWIFHGEQDRIPIQRARALAGRLEATGNESVRFTAYPDAGHDIFDRVYAEAELSAWLLGQSADLEAIKRQARRFSQAYVDGDLTTLLDIYTPDGVAAAGNGDFVRGRDALERLWQLPEGRAILRHSTHPEALEVEGDMAYDWGYYEGQATQDGAPLGPFRGKYVIVWKRGGDGVWRMALDVWSGVPEADDP